MKDQVTLDRINLLHPKLRDEVVKMYDEIVAALTGSAICRFAYTLRTFAEQDALYAQGRTKGGLKVTNAKGGQSYHNYGLAIDIVLLVDKDKNGTYEKASWDIKTDFDGDGKDDVMVRNLNTTQMIRFNVIVNANRLVWSKNPLAGKVPLAYVNKF